MRRPLIGLTPSIGEGGQIQMKRAYLDSVYAAGGYPVVLPPYACDFRGFDGFIFTGGVDIHPKYYGEEVLPECGEIDAVRDEFEQKLFDKVGARPILGICRGMQVINVFMGGTLHQHIPSHSQAEARDVATHAVTLENPLRARLGAEKICVNSFHHQAIKALAPELSAVAHAADGTVEAVYAPGARFLWAVQWHPEDGDFGSSSERIFYELIRAC